MMKRSAVKIIAAAIVLMASCALAEVQDFGSYTVDVIDGWTAVPQGETVYFIKNDNSASWSVMFGEVPGGASVEQYARDIMTQTKGTNFSDNGKGAYEFTFTNQNGQATSVVITSMGGSKFMQWGVTGMDKAENEIRRLINSMTAKEAAPVKILNSKYFTFAVPGGWNGYEIDETSVRVEKDDESASMYVEIEDLDGWEADDLAEFYAKEHNAKDLEKEGSTYTFSYEEDGRLNVASFRTDGKIYVLVINTANDKAGFDAIAKLRGVLKRK